MPRPGLRFAAAALSLALGAAAGNGTAHAFSGGNHERITRAALPWESRSLTAMADADSGAIVANDKGSYFDQGFLHCDNADYLDSRYGPNYPRTREQANTELIACIRGSVTRFKQAVAAADGLVDADGKVKPREVDLNTPCAWNEQPDRAKCTVYENLGRGWHAIEDFYSHSNWADQAGPYPIGVHNPPGLKKETLPEFFSVRRYSAMSEREWTQDATSHIPLDLSTGCYPDLESTHKRADCTGRTTHDNDLSKDTMGYNRSRIDSNFDRAVQGATNDVKRQWQDFQDELRQRYGSRGDTMICALTHDDPAHTCS
ncbi:hypothetical protein [Streptomyces acidicola]|uniref:CinY protein n=1 Tax=Streptomyces acidicola TaxID=2596892 RepID=A0A5N8X1T4_9ACTN|nr:hypothetical protein [Streptomyces acidicola]MPY52986.1 hypothetical protein [Streptomyces acidicola]